MENPAQLLDKLLETLQALNGVLEEEHDLLCSGQLPGVALQRVTDAKANCWRRSPTSSNNAREEKPAGNAPLRQPCALGRSLAARSTAEPNATRKESAQWPAAQSADRP